MIDNDKDVENLNKLKDIVEKHCCQYFRILNRKENTELLRWIEEKTPLLNSSFYKLSTKVFWVLNGITEFPRCKNKDCNKEMRQNVGLNSRSYRDYCCNKCAGHCSYVKAQITKEQKYGDKHYVNRKKAIQTTLERYGTVSNMQSEKGKAEYLVGLQKKYGSDITNVFQIEQVKEKSKMTKKEKYGNETYHNTKKLSETLRKKTKEEWAVIRKKSEETCLKRYGYRYPMQDPNNRKGNNGIRYKYNGVYFDSKEEVSVFIWLKDIKRDFAYHNGEYFEFQFNGKVHRYFPDFKVDEEFWELKGEQFFKNKSYRMSTPYAKTKFDNLLFQAKYDCMIRNGVKIFKTTDKFVIECVNYVKTKFGIDFFKTIKIRSNKSLSVNKCN